MQEAALRGAEGGGFWDWGQQGQSLRPQGQEGGHPAVALWVGESPGPAASAPLRVPLVSGRYRAQTLRLLPTGLDTCLRARSLGYIYSRHFVSATSWHST